MKHIKSVPYNAQKLIVGRITFGKSLLGRSNNILVAKDAVAPSMGYLATITSSTSFRSSEKPYFIVDSTDIFSEGDVVTLHPSGDILFVYERLSKHNALMVTELCNHRCIMCPQPPVVKEHARILQNLQIISLMSRHTAEIGLTGGEPTIIGDDLFVLINHIRKKLPRTSISILSNGVKFADKNYAFKLAKCKHHDLQVDVPLFSDIAREHNRIVGANTFYKTVQGLYNLATFHQRIGLRMVIHKQTYKRLPQFAEFVYRNFPFVVQIAFMQMETVGYARDNINDLWIDPHDYTKELREAVLLLHRKGMKVFIYNAQLCVLPEDIRRFAVQSISDWKDVYISECEGCTLKAQCAGFFASDINHHSSHIHRIQKP